MSSKKKIEGTLSKIVIGGILQSTGLALVQVLGLPSTAQAVAAVLGALGGRSINVPVIVQSHGIGEYSNVVLAVHQSDLPLALSLLQSVGDSVGARAVDAIPNVGMVAIFGPHFRDRPAIAGTMFAALAGAGIDLIAISTSISTVSCLIAEVDVPRAVAVLEETFTLP